MVVGRLGSIRRAADELHVSASAIDRQILKVEADIGMPLFERLSTDLRLTAAGEIMMAAGGNWQKSMTTVRAQIEDLRGLKRGHVDIAIIDALAKGYVPQTIHAIQRRHPGITIGIKVLNNDAVRRAIATGTVDCGIFFGPETFRDIVVRAYVDVVLGFFTPVDHAIGKQSEARFSALVGLAMVLPAPPLAVCQQIAVLEGITGATVEQSVSSDNIQMLKSLVLQRVGVGILTSIDVMTEVANGELSFTRISDSILRPMTLALCTASARTPSYAAGIVLREFENSFAQLSYPDCMKQPSDVGK